LKKLFALIFIPGLIMAGIFFALGDSFDAALNQQAFQDKFNSSNAWLAALGLLIADLLLPIPASGIMAAIGSLYGLFTGTLINFCGFTSAGLVGYAVARLLGQKTATWLCSEEELSRFKNLFDQWGGTAVILSRAFPILPEVLALLAGFNRMNFYKFTTSLILGCFPVSLLYTWLGVYSKNSPAWGIAVAVTLPLLLWLVLNKVYKKSEENL
jgi:uncharacterized membrane protein YdjX (TVP38/TMEM64 family)